MAHIAIQLYTLRAVDEPLSRLIERVSAAGFEGVEYANRIDDPATDVDAVVDALESAGITSVAAHVGIDTLEDDLAGTVAFSDTLGCDHLVVPWLDAEHFESRSAIETTAGRLTAIADDLADHDVTLSYHNHDHEFVDVDGRQAFERLVEASGDALSFEVDLGWAAVAGADPVSLLERYGDRIRLVHVSDADRETLEPTAVGEGVLDVEACAQAVRESDVEWAIYEHDEPSDPLASIEHGAEVLSRF